MSASFSAYLDLIRFTAALAVFVAHLASFPFTNHVLWSRLGQFGDAAVTVFFVLSGYVISFVLSGRENHPEAYLGGRASRLYSVVLVALPLTFMFDTIGMAVNPEFYNSQKVLWKPESWAGYLSSMLFVNEYQIFGFNGISPGTNGPFWSLSFEATYYVLAGIALFCRRTVWIPVTLIILALSGRTIAALLPIWLLGFVLYRVRIPEFKSTFYLQAAFWSSAALIVFSPIIEDYLPHTYGLMRLPWGRGPFNRDLMNDYFIALAFVAHLVFAKAALANGFKPIDQMKPVIRWLGSLTFPLYLFQFPALCLFAAISPWDDASMRRVVFISVLTFFVVVVLTPVCENLKGVIRRKMILRDFIHPKVLGFFARHVSSYPRRV